MQIDILPYTKERIPDVINFEENLRRQENFWGWKIDQAYRENVEKSFCSPEFSHSLSLLAYVEGKVVGRIDSGMRLPPTLKAPAKLIWIGSAF